jgi:hypothetical protein
MDVHHLLTKIINLKLELNHLVYCVYSMYQYTYQCTVI